jgi:Flp pilus assembly protein TadD
MEFAAAHTLLSKILIERGHYAEALAEADRALQQEATVEEGHLNRARALEGLGRGEEAVVEYRRARGAFHVPGLM